MLKRKSKGTLTKEFKIVSGKAYITDPCYKRGTWCQALVESVRNGKWNAWVEKSGEGYCAVLLAWHSDKSYDSVRNDASWLALHADICVDSGQAGIFDEKHYRSDASVKGVKRENPEHTIRENEPFYSMCCDRTLGSEQWGVIPYGVISSSGFGDGAYMSFVIVEDNEIVAIKIVFIDDSCRENEDE